MKPTLQWIATNLMPLMMLSVVAGACDSPPSPAVPKSPMPLYSGASDPEPVQSLPAHVQAPAGQLTLYADFEHPRDDGIVLYLVNRTDRNLAFNAQDGDPYIKLEAKSDAGAFERAQSHRSAWCGNSYFYSPLLKPGEFIRLLGYPAQHIVRRLAAIRADEVQRMANRRKGGAAEAASGIRVSEYREVRVAPRVRSQLCC